MVFSSIVFLLYFLPLFLLGYYLVPKKIKNIYILLASIAFYSWGAPRFIFVILLTTFLDFHLVRLMDKAQNENKRKSLLIISVCMNMGLLFYFKYCNFFIDNVNTIFSLFHLQPWSLLNVVLPIGISFYTFESLTYVIDVYRKEHKPLDNFMNYQLYIILFPKLIAGPIIRYSQIADQITNRFETFRYQHAIRGFHRFCIGLSKKVIIANAVGQYADLAFSSDLSNLSSGVAWLGMLAYTMQIYFDFSGYSDMAIGLGQMMGFRFPENFDNPYTSRSITEFWRRWHITLGTWMKNYLYIPLGGNRVASTSRLFFNLWIVFILSGFWHGASWTFIAWGAFHGLFLILDRLGLKKILDTIGTISSILFSFLIINIGWVFFRANSITDAFHYLKALVSFNRTETAISCNYNEFYFTLIIAVVFSFFIVCKPFKKLHDYVYYRDLSILATVSVTIISLFAFAICVSLITASSFNPFIYFRF